MRDKGPRPHAFDMCDKGLLSQSAFDMCDKGLLTQSAFDMCDKGLLTQSAFACFFPWVGL